MKLFFVSSGYILGFIIFFMGFLASYSEKNFWSVVVTAFLSLFFLYKVFANKHIQKYQREKNEKKGVKYLKKYDITPQEKRKANIVLVIFGLLIAFSIGGISQIEIKEDKQVVKNSEWDGSVVQVKRFLKNTLNDPDSYDPVEWGQVVKDPTNEGGYLVRHKYRARNAFGGMIMKHQIFKLDSLGNVYYYYECD